MISTKWAAVVIGAVTMFGIPGQSFGAAVATAGGGGAAASAGGHTTGGGGGAVSGGAAPAARVGGGGIASTPPPVTPGSGAHTPVSSVPAKVGHIHGHDQNRGQYPYGVAYPYSPFAYGYGGDYDNGYGSNGVVNTNNSQATFDNSNPSGSTTTDNGTSAAAQITPTSPDVNSEAARSQNAADHSPQLLALQADVQKDQQQYTAARDRVLEQLRTQPDYQKAVADRRSARTEVKAAKTVDANNSSAVMSAAEAKLNAGDAVTKMEQSAIDQDQAAATAKAKLADDMTKLTAMRGSAGIK